MLQISFKKIFTYSKKRRKASTNNSINKPVTFRTTLPDEQLGINEWHRYIHSQFGKVAMSLLIVSTMLCSCSRYEYPGMDRIGCKFKVSKGYTGMKANRSPRLYR